MSTPPRRCTATSTSTGEPCRAVAVSGADLCSAHLGVAHRPTSFTPEVGEQIVQLLRVAVPVGVALAARGVAQRTFHDWLEHEGEPFATFRGQVARARAEAEASLVAVVQRSAIDTPSSAMWLLEREWPERWARVSQRAEEPEKPPADDPFLEFDELAARRRRGA
jgi:hypothetical protein